jgi:hypothetical protein
MSVPRERLLDRAALNLGCTVLVASSLLGDGSSVTERLAHLLAGESDGCTFTLCFNVELVDVSLGHGCILPHSNELVNTFFRIFFLPRLDKSDNKLTQFRQGERMCLCVNCGIVEEVQSCLLATVFPSVVL